MMATKVAWAPVSNRTAVTPRLQEVINELTTSFSFCIATSVERNLQWGIQTAPAYKLILGWVLEYRILQLCFNKEAYVQG